MYANVCVLICDCTHVVQYKCMALYSDVSVHACGRMSFEYIITDVCEVMSANRSDNLSLRSYPAPLCPCPLSKNKKGIKAYLSSVFLLIKSIESLLKGGNIFFSPLFCLIFKNGPVLGKNGLPSIARSSMPAATTKCGP